MSVRIDITGLRRERVAVVPSPLAELGMALHVLAEPGHHPGRQGWVTGVTAGLDAHLADRMCEADFLWRTTFSDLFMPFAGIPGREALPGETLADDLDLLDKLTDEQFADAGMEFVCTPGYDSQARGVLSDPDRRGLALELAAARGPRQLRFARQLLADPPGVRAWLRQFLEDCDEAFFAETWSRLHHRSFGLSRSEPDQPHAPNGLGRTGLRRTQPRGSDTDPVRGPIPGGRFPHDLAIWVRPEATGRPRTITPVEQGPRTLAPQPASQIARSR